MTTDPHMDCHMHSTYSDGSTSIELMAESAIEKGLTTIVITDHMPLPFDTRYAMALDQITAYRNEIDQARKKYSGSLTILAGIEMEYIPIHRSWIKQIAELGWDMRLVSIHGIMPEQGNTVPVHFMVNGREDEFRQTLKSVFNNDIQAFCTRYYTLIQEAAETGWFDVVGHMDVIKKHNRNNRYFDENADWYTDLIHTTLDTIARTGMAMELNTNGLNHPAAAFYPSAWIIRQARERGIPICLGSDAHSPGFQGQYFDQARINSQVCGFQFDRDPDILRTENKNTITQESHARTRFR